MDIALAWLIAGIVLIIAELVTGTFYLLVLGVAALVGGAIGYAGASFDAQGVGAAAVAVAGIIWVRRHRRSIDSATMRSLDVGQAVSFDCWVDQPAGRARVRYRDTLWDARISGAADGEPGESLYITSVDGNTLAVSKTRPT